MKNYNYLFLLVLSILLININFACAEEKTSITSSIAVLIPLTGSSAEQGQWIKEGAILAEEEFNRNSKQKVKAIFEDTQGDSKTAISSYYSLFSKTKFPAVITYGSGVAVALSPLTNKDKVIQMGVATATPAYRSFDDYTFRNFPSAELDSAFVVNSILEKFKSNAVAIVSIQNEFGVASAKAFKELFLKKSGKIITEEEIEPNGTDYRSVIMRLKRKQAKVIYFPVYPLEGAIFLKQAKELGLEAQFIASAAIIGSKQFMEIAKGAAEGLVVSTAAPVFLEDQDHEIQKFVQAYKAKFNEEVNIQHIYAARSYDAFLILAKGIEKCGENTDCLKDYLFSVKNYHGTSGNLSFDRNGDVTVNFKLEKVVNGVFKPISF